MLQFSLFQAAVAKQFAVMTPNPMFRVDLTKDEMWATYLGAFPEGTDLIYRKRTQHDCSCCRHFIRDVGNVVAVVDNKIVTIWDGVSGEPAYDAVAAKMAELVRSKPIIDAFLHDSKSAGTQKTFEQMLDGSSHRWDHFHVNVPAQFVAKRADIPARLGKIRDAHAVMVRGLREFNLADIDTVLELIAQNSLYRGAEFKHMLTEFRALKLIFKDDPAWTWSTIDTMPANVCCIRNTAIGTLLQDLAEGKTLEDAVRAYEIKVAPNNYRRSTALVTKNMVSNAREKVEELGLTSALERRYATIADIDVNNLLFVRRSTTKPAQDDPFNVATAPGKRSFDKVESVSIDKFVTDILPKTTALEVMLDNEHAGNLMSLVAPVDPTAAQLFKWNNGFSWSYQGDVADSIKERVKKAGGNVTGDVCCRLAWFNFDDLDLHMQDPHEKIYFGNKKPARTTGQLDVDMNAGAGHTRTPVENIFYPSLGKMASGKYSLSVHCWSKREGKDDGFEVEVDVHGDVRRFAYNKPMRQGQYVAVVDMEVSNGKVSFSDRLPPTSVSRSMWGLDTGHFHAVTAVMLSPNYWNGNGVGNKHYFFMLENCINPGTVRGFYNEFLRADLNEHRKVLEMVGAKMSTSAAMHQLSGLGFSSTQRDSLLCKVTGAFTRVIRVTF